MKNSIRRGFCLVSQNYLPGTSLLAYIMAPKIELSFDESLANFQQRQDLVSLWNQDMIEDGMNVIYSDANISIIEYEENNQSKTLCRGLYFNENLDLVQTSVPINKETKKVDFSIPLPLESNKHIVGFSFALLYHHLNTQGSVGSFSRCAVLGAGGCSLPIILSLLYPHLTVDGIENNPAIVNVAREYFGITTLGLENKIKLHESCAFTWLQRQLDDTHTPKYDLLFVDIYDVPPSPVEVPTTEESLKVIENQPDTVTLDYEAPAEVALTNENISNYLKILSNSGVVAVNVLGNDLGTAVVLHRIQDGVVEYLASLPNDAISYPKFAVGIMKLPFQAKESDPGDGSDINLPRHNSIIYIVKNPSQQFQDLIKDKDSIVDKLMIAMQSVSASHEKRVNYPFSRTGEESEIIRNWLKTVQFLKIER